MTSKYQGDSFKIALTFKHKGKGGTCKVSIGLAPSQLIGHSTPIVEASKLIELPDDIDWAFYSETIEGNFPSNAGIGSYDCLKGVEMVGTTISLKNWDEDRYEVVSAPTPIIYFDQTWVNQLVLQIQQAPDLVKLEELRTSFEIVLAKGQISESQYSQLYNAYVARYYTLVTPAPIVYTCPYCGATFTSQMALDSHIATYHPPTPIPTSGWNGVSLPTVTQILNAQSYDELSKMYDRFNAAYPSEISYDYYMTLYNSYVTRWYQL